MLNLKTKRKHVWIYLVIFSVFMYVWNSSYEVGLSSYVLYSTESCPVCYGYTACDKFYTNYITIDGERWSDTNSMKMTYYGTSRMGTTVLLKRVVSQHELNALDANLCKTFDLPNNCKPDDALNTELLNRKVLESVATEKLMTTERVRGLVMCPNATGIFDMLDPFVRKSKKLFENDMLNMWTMLTVSPEPIMLQLMRQRDDWPVPAYGGVCGRLEIVTYEGEPISTTMDYRRKLRFAKGIIDAALQFTYKHDRYRFYLMDWSLENIVADDDDEITFVDLEDFVILDKYQTPENSSDHAWLRETGVANKPGRKFHDYLCKHHISDHNIWEACNLINTLLYPVPDYLNSSKELIENYLLDCLRDSNNRFRSANHLKLAIMKCL